MTSIARCKQFPADELPCLISYEALQSRGQFQKECEELQKINRLSFRFYHEALSGAAILGVREVIREIIEIAGRELCHYEDFSKRTPLIWAIIRSKPLVVRDIARYGVDLNITTSAGKTALWFALHANKVPLVVFLLKNGARTPAELNEKEKNILARAQSAIDHEIDSEAQQLHNTITCIPLELAKIIAMYYVD